MDTITKQNLEELKEDIVSTINSLGLNKKKIELKSLQIQTNEPDFWKDQNRAKLIMSTVERLQGEVNTSKKLMDDINTIIEIFAQTPEENVESLREDIVSLEKEFRKFQTLKFLSGKYDSNNAILSIHSGQGGTEANDWAQMLMRMYLRYCEKQGWKAEVLHMVSGSEVGISTATIQIEGTFTFGKLKKEAGTHRLIRLSPFNSQNLRQTSFAGVEVIPVINDDSDVVIRDEDIEFKAVRASGAGGQYVNKTSSAVQIKHIPTGITVHSSERRDQHQNKIAALNILKAKLWQIEEEKKEKELQSIKGEHKIAGWGNQIRNYILHPYKLVKDLRTGIEITNPEAVLDGDLNELIEAQIRIG